MKKAGSFLAIATILGVPVWMDYLQGSFLFYFTLLLAPFVLYCQHTGTSSTRYGWWSIWALLGHLYLGINVLFLAGYLFFVLFLVEWQWGKLNSLSIYWIFLLSPLTIFLFGIFSFPIRLKLSEIANYFLSFVVPNINCQGNMLVLEGVEFSVDEVCMGLNMVGYSYLAILVLLAQLEKKAAVQLSKPIIFGILSLGTCLILIANLLRIIVIVFFKAMPGTSLHELLGLASWIIYVILPSYFIIKISVQKWGKNIVAQAPYQIPKQQAYSIITSCLILLALGGYNNLSKDKNPPKATVYFEAGNLDQSTAKDGVLQLKNEEVLIYVKPAAPAYRADHAPNICWKGSGYEFRKEATKTIQGIEVMYAQLQKGDEVLHTVWWYDNGVHQTASQLDWRWNSLKGQGGYQLINVTTENIELLEKYVGLARASTSPQ